MRFVDVTSKGSPESLGYLDNASSQQLKVVSSKALVDQGNGVSISSGSPYSRYLSYHDERVVMLQYRGSKR